MSNSQTTRQKRTAHNDSIHRDRSYHAVPSDWMRLGTDEHGLEDRDRFYAEKICYEYVLEHDSAAVGGVVERHRLVVAYRRPHTTDAVERTYRAAVFETDADAVVVTTPAVEPDDGTGWGTVPYPALKPEPNAAVIPRAVHRGKPAEFRSSVAVHPDEPRIGDGRGD